MSHRNFTAIVLAGDRGRRDPVAQAANAPCKALCPVAGKPMVWRVIETLRTTAAIDRILLVGPCRSIMDAQPALAGELEAAGVTWLPPAASPSQSAETALAEVANDQAVLLTTADHAALTTQMLTTMLEGSAGCDLAVGLTRYRPLRQAYPDSRRTVLRFEGGGYCGCNLFVINNARGRRLITLWRDVTSMRKHPARMLAGLLGWATVSRYLLRRLSLEAALDVLSKRSGTIVGVVLLPQPEAAVDVDSPEDLRQVEAIIKARERKPA